MMNKILISLMLIMGIIAQAQEKILVSEDKERIGKYYIYPSSIEKYKNYLKVWEERQFAIPERMPSGKEYSVMKSQLLIDCNGMKDAVIVISLYNKNGNLVGSSKRSDLEAERELEPNPPRTVGWDVIENTCNYYYGSN